MTHNRQRPLLRYLLAALATLAASLAPVTPATAQTPVVTVIINGYQPVTGWTYDVNWMAEMAEAINARGGGDVYDVLIRRSLLYVGSLETIAPPIATSSRGAIILVNWSAAASCDPFCRTSTADVAREVASLLLGNPNLTALPIHLIGHSRGGSVVSEVARLLGTRGVWVDQQTTLDPHPIWSVDADVSNVWQNVLYADNYFRNGGLLAPDGELVPGARNVDLNGIIVQPTVDEWATSHVDVHTYYHGTIDLGTNYVDGRYLPSGWYVGDAGPRDGIGYSWSRVGGGVSKRVTDGLDGYHLQLSGGAQSGQRWPVPVDTTKPSWPNIALKPLGSDTFTIGTTIPVSFYFQDRQTDFNIVFRLDDNTNPFDVPNPGNAIAAACAQFNQGNVPQVIGPNGDFVKDADDIRSGSILLNTSGAAAASCYLRAEINSNWSGFEVLKRFDYLPNKITLTTAPAPLPLTAPTVLGPGAPSGPGPIVVSVTPQITWTAVPAATTGYGLAISEFPYGASRIIYLRDSASPLTGTSFSVPAGALSPGTRYRLNMTSFGGGAESAVSNTLYFQTPGTGGANYVVQTSASPSYGGSTSGGGTVAGGAQVVVNAVASPGFTFSAWTEAGSQVSPIASYSFTVNGSRTLVANFLATGIPPTIATQPQSAVITAGATAVLRVTAVGGSPLSYQWRKYGVAMAGQTSDTLTLSTVSPSDTGAYTVLVSNPTGTQLSQVATLTVNGGSSLRVINGIWLGPPPYVVNGTTPVSVMLQNVSNATLVIDRIQVDGSFQDYFNDPPYTRNWPAQTFSPALSLPPGSSYLYQGVNTADVFPGFTATATVQVYVKFAGVPGLQVVTDAEPGDSAIVGFQTIDPNLNYPISATVSPAGAGVVSGTGSHVAGTLATLTATANNCFAFRHWTRSGVPVANTPVYAFQVNDTPTLVAHFDPIPCDLGAAVVTDPQSRSVLVGESASFSVTSAGAQPFGYQWQRDGQDISGATSPTYTVPAAQLSDSGAQFRVVVVNPLGTVTSNPAALTVNAPTASPTLVFSTLAGLAGSGGSADGAGAAARFLWPQGVAVDGAGTVYVADTDNHTIRRITSAGVVTTLAGVAGIAGVANGTGSAARFSGPRGIAVDTAGVVYVADTGNHTIRKVTPAGAVTTLAGLPGGLGSTNGTGSVARFNSPHGVTVDAAGVVYVADTLNATIRRVTPDGVVTTLAGLPGVAPGGADGTGSAARFYYPDSVAVDAVGTIYVADYGNGTIRKVTQAGVVTTLAGLAGSSGSADGTGSAARFYFPMGIASDAMGTLYVSDTGNHTIREITPDGAVTTVAGSAGVSGATDGIGAATRFNLPSGVAVGATGAIYVTEGASNTVRVGVPSASNVVQNNSFESGVTGWLTYATPDPAYIVSNVTNGVFEFYRTAPPPGTSNQALVFQETRLPVPANGPVVARFDLGNSSTVRKRVSVLLHDSNFSDLAVCTFWLPANSPLRTYGLSTHSTQAWTNATISFYAATVGSNGGFYQLDNVSVEYEPAGSSTETSCLDPTVPTPTAEPDGPNLLVNGNFGTGAVAPWGLYGQITSQVTSGVFEFVRPAGTPSGVLLQATGQPVAANQLLTAAFQLGNSSSVRKRVTVILHDNDFGDLSACTFWLSPGQPLGAYVVRMFTTKAWTNATLSVYPATVGLEQWIRFDNATLRRTPSATIPGASCLEPGVGADALMADGLATPQFAPLSVAPAPIGSLAPQGATAGPSIESSGEHAGDEAVGADGWLPEGFAPATEPSTGTDDGGWVALAGDKATSTLTRSDVLDLTRARSASLLFRSWLTSISSRAEVQASLDGVTWETVHVIELSDTWMPVVLDLEAYLGEVVHLRFAFGAAAEQNDGTAFNGWRLEAVHTDVDEPVVATNLAGPTLEQRSGRRIAVETRLRGRLFAGEAWPDALMGLDVRFGRRSPLLRDSNGIRESTLP